MLKHYMHRREKKLALRNDNRSIQTFGWGTEFADPRFVDRETKDLPSHLFFKQYAKNAIENSDQYFAVAKIDDEFNLEHNHLTWTSQIETVSTQNNTVHARFFPVKDKRRAVVILPHWNAPRESYVALCKVLNRVGIAALRLTMPYHEDRQPLELERADHLISANIGRTLQSIQQAVVDARTAVAWLKKQGFERIGIVGTSIGSCAGFLSMVHEANINAAVFNHVSGYCADVVWRGISTYHVKQGLEEFVNLNELREYWLPISPMAYVQKLQKLPMRPVRYIYTLYDLSFPIDLSRETFAAFREHNIKHEASLIPCGHYTLGEPPWVYVDGWKIVTFLRKHL